MNGTLGPSKEIKGLMRKKFMDHFEKHADDWIGGKISASQCRLLFAQWLSEAWKEFFAADGQEKVGFVNSSATVTSATRAN